MEAIANFFVSTGFYQFFQGDNWKSAIMLVIAVVLLFLGIVKKFEPLLLVPIAFGMLVTNLPGAEMFHEILFAGGHVHWDLFGGEPITAQFLSEMLANGVSADMLQPYADSLMTAAQSTFDPGVLDNLMAQLAASGSEAVGTLSIGETGEEVFIGREWVQNKNFSEDTARLVDSEVKRIVEEAHARCRKLLQDNEETLHRIARALLDRETITGDDLDLLMENKELPPLDINGKPLKSSRPGGPQNRDKGGDFVLEPDDAGQETSGDAAAADAMGQTPPATPETDPSRPEPATTPTPEQADHAGQADLKDPADHAEQDKK